MAFHLITDGSPTERARTPYAADLDGYTSGFFLMARIRSDDLVGFGDEQCIASMWRGPGDGQRTFLWNLNSDGTFSISFIESAATTFLHISGVVTTDQGVSDGDDFWIGASVRFAPGAFAQHYWGGTGTAPVWATWGAESSENSGVTDLKSDSSNDLTIGDNRYSTGPEDEFNGAIYEYRQFNNAFGLGTLVAYFNAADFAINDGNTDTAVGAAGNTWTLTGSADMIADDSAETTQGSVTFTTYDTPHRPESVGHAEKYSLWRWYDGFRTARVIIITGGVATPSPGAATATVDQYANADAGSGQNGQAIWHSNDAAQLVTSTEASILRTAGYIVI